MQMDGADGETIVDVGKAAEAVSVEGETSSFLYATESLCMRCGENVCCSPEQIGHLSFL